jgi:hypothetical protein
MNTDRVRRSMVTFATNLKVLSTQRPRKTTKISSLSNTSRLCSGQKIYLLVTHHVLNHSAVCLTTGPKPLPKRALHIVRSRASSFRCEYPFLSLMSSSSFLRLLTRPSVTSIPPYIFPSITYRRRQFLRNTHM